MLRIGNHDAPTEITNGLEYARDKNVREPLAALWAIWKEENPLPPDGSGSEAFARESAEIESYFRAGRWLDLLTLFRTCGSEAGGFRVLELIAPFMERGELTREVATLYTGSKCSADSLDDVMRILKLVRAADLGRTVPAGLPDPVRIFRGVVAIDRNAGRHRIVSGISWTLSHQIAMNFARGLPACEPAPTVPILPELCGYVGEGRIRPNQILAYFHDWRAEFECVIDPLDVFDLTIQELGAVPTRA